MKVKEYLLYILPILIFIGLYHLATPSGLVSTDDSLQFKHAAQVWAEDGRLEEIGGQAFVHWPPLFPVLLSFLLPDIEGSLKIINGLLLIASILIWTQIYKESIKDNLLLWCLVLVSACSLHPILLGRFIWVESLMIFFLSLLIYNYLNWLGWKSIVIVLVVSVLLVLLRTASVFFLVNIFICCFFLENGKTRWEKITCLIPSIFVWVGYRLLYSKRGIVGEFDGLTVEASIDRTIEHIKWYYGFIRELLMPFIELSLVLELVVLVGLVGLVFYLKKRVLIPQSIKFIGAIILLYVNQVMLSAVFKNFGDNAEVFRYLGVVSFGLFLLFYYLLDSLVVNSKVKYAVYAVGFFVVSINFLRTIYNISQWNNWW